MDPVVGVTRRASLMGLSGKACDGWPKRMHDARAFLGLDSGARRKPTHGNLIGKEGFREFGSNSCTIPETRLHI